MSELVLTIAEAARALRSGQLSCQQILEDCLSRIDRLESEMQAWVLVDRDGARRVAAERDEELKAGGPRSPLHGIPIGVKDIIDVAGWPTGAGSVQPVVARAQSDAPVVDRLRRAGAVILGKTVTTPFACFDPSQTRNPWAPDRTPGGSSSGSAAAVATGMCLAALGTQTGGSIIRPATYCGVCGFKPSYDAVSLEGVFPVATSLDHVGPIARSVEDAAALFAVIADGSPFDARRDSGGCPRPAFNREKSRAELTEEAGPPNFDSEGGPLPGAGPPPRIGVLEDAFFGRADKAVQEAFQKASARLQTAGARLERLGPATSLSEILQNHRTIMAAEAAAVHRDRFQQSRKDYPPRLQELIDEGLRISAAAYILARQHQRRSRDCWSAFFQRVDALICPATPGPAPDRSTTGDPRFNSPWSYLGLPTVSFPIALAASRLPLGIQVIGPPGQDARLLQYAAWCEREVGFETPVPPL